MEFVDRQTGKLVPIPDDQAQAAFQSGRYGLPKGARLPIVDSGGSVGTVDAKDASAILRQGSRVASPEEYHGAENESKYGGTGGAIGAGLVGAARGAVESVTGQPFDPLVTNIAALTGSHERASDPFRGEYISHPEDRAREAMGQLQERHSLASFAGEAAGFLGGAALTGGGGALGRTGALAEHLVPKTLGGFGGAVARGAVRGAAEGGVLGGLGAIDEAALGNVDVAAENVIAGIGHGALIGGAAGGLLSGAVAGVGSGLGSARDDVGKFVQGLRPKEVDALAERHFGHAAEGIGDKVQKAYSKLAAGVSGKDVGAIETLTALSPEGAEARRIAVFDAPKIQEQAAKDIRAAGDTMLQAGQLVADEARGGLKANYVARAVKTGNEADNVHAAMGWLEKLLDGASTELGGDIAPQYTKSVESVSKAVYRARAEIADAVGSGENINAKVLISIDNVKRDIQRLTSSGYRSIRNIADPIEQRLAKRTVGWLDASASELRTHLESVERWGKAAEDQQAINEAWTKQIDAQKRFHGALTTDVGRDPTNPYVTRRGIDPGKAETYVKGLVNPNNDLTHKAVTDYVRSTSDLAKTINEAYELPADKIAEVERIHAAAKHFDATVAGAEKSLVLANQYRHLTEGHKDSVSALAGTLGFAVGGLPGGVLGAVAGAVTNPGHAIAQMAAVERLAAKVRGRVSEGVRSFLSGSKAASAVPASTEILQSAKGRPQREVFEKSVKEVQRLAANPAEQAERIARSTGGISERAPKVTAAIARLAVAGTKYLSDHAPPGFAPQAGLIPSNVPLYSDQEMGEWTRRAAVINDYTVVLHSMKAGHITPEEVDALKVINPHAYTQIRSDLISQPDKLAKLSFGKQIVLSILFEFPANVLMEPAFMADIQQSFTTAPMPENGAPTPSRPKSIDVGQSAKIAATVGQDVTGRDRP